MAERVDETAGCREPTARGAIVSDREQVGIPPSLDVRRHLKQVRRMAIPALLIAILAGVVTQLVLSSRPPAYQADVVAQIDAQTPVIPSEAYIFQMTAPYTALAGSTEVQSAVAKAVGSGWTASQVASNVKVELAKSPLLLNISATADSPQQAIKASEEMVLQLDAAARRQRQAEIASTLAGPQKLTADLTKQLEGMPDNDPRRADLVQQINDANNQIDRIRFGGVNGLSILSAPDLQSVKDSTASAWYIPFFVAVAVWIIAVEALVFFASRWGTAVSVAWSERIAAKHRMAFERNDGSWPQLPPRAAAALGATVNGGGSALVILTKGVIAAPPAIPRVSVVNQDAHDWQFDLRPADLFLLIASRAEGRRSDVAQVADAIAILDAPAYLILDGEAPNERGDATAEGIRSSDAALL